MHCTLVEAAYKSSNAVDGQIRYAGSHAEGEQTILLPRAVDKLEEVHLSRLVGPELWSAYSRTLLSV